jgi:hypothetical protein
MHIADTLPTKICYSQTTAVKLTGLQITSSTLVHKASPRLSDASLMLFSDSKPATLLHAIQARAQCQNGNAQSSIMTAW